MEASKELEQTIKLRKLINSQDPTSTFIEKILAVDTISCNTLWTELKFKSYSFDYKWFFIVMIYLYEYYRTEFKGLEEHLDKEVLNGLIMGNSKIFSGKDIGKEEIIEYISLRSKLREKVKWLENERKNGTLG